MRFKIGFRKGDSVRIKEGAFEDYRGQVEETDAAKGSVLVRISIFGRSTPVDLNIWQVEKS